MDDTPSAVIEPSDFDLTALQLCRTFSEFPGSHIAPTIPTDVLNDFLRSTLDLQDDEVLLAIVRQRPKDPAGFGCALTTRRIYSMTFPKSGRPRSFPSLTYEELPESIDRDGSFTPSIDLGENRKLVMGGNKPVQESLIFYLREIRRHARGEPDLPEVPGPIRDGLRTSWPSVITLSDQARSIQAEIRHFDERHKQSRVVVTPLLFFACFGIYLAMLATGVSAINPSIPSMLSWGANFGPSLAFDHEPWRLMTCVFLHFGFLHLALNMWCLISAGPAVERFFGSVSFAALYLLSGLGGSVASTWTNPAAVSAGASGAIFGIYGGLVGYLAIRHRDVPTAILKPMRSSAVAFIGYNLVFGLADKSIGTAAHVGGLATGFVVGLLLMLVSPRSTGSGGAARLFGRLGVVATVTLALCLLAREGIKLASERIFADPKLGPIYRGVMFAAPEWNEFNVAADPVLAEFDQIGAELDRITSQLDQGRVTPRSLLSKVDDQISHLNAIGNRIESLPAKNDEIRGIRDQITQARTHLGAALNALRLLIVNGDENLIDGKEGFLPSMNAYKKDFEQFGTLRDAYFKAHNLTPETPENSPAGQNRP
jgi:rhomboid protease GluP